MTLAHFSNVYLFVDESAFSPHASLYVSVNFRLLCIFVLYISERALHTVFFMQLLDLRHPQLRVARRSLTPFPTDLQCFFSGAIDGG